MWVMNGEIRDAEQAGLFQAQVMNSAIVGMAHLGYTILYDLSTFTVTLFSQMMARGSGLSQEYIDWCISLTAVLFVLEMIFALLLLETMYSIQFASSWLAKARLDRSSVEADLEKMGFMWCYRYYTILYYTILYYNTTTLYYTLLHSTTLYYAVL